MNAKATIDYLVLPFKILISPFKTLNQLAQAPTVKGFVSLVAFLMLFTATTLYAFASRIFVNINGAPIAFVVTSPFNSWYTGSFTLALVYILIYWVMVAMGLALIGKIIGKKDTSWRALFIVFGYLLSVFIVLYAVRTIMYLSLPSIYFPDSNSWPPADQAQQDAALSLVNQDWGTLIPYHFLSYLPIIAFVWLAILGTVAVRVLHEVSWTRSITVSLIGFFITLFILGLPPT